MEIDRKSTDAFVYQEEYLKHLSKQLQQGEVEWDDLTDAEEEELRKYLSQSISNAMTEYKLAIKTGR